MQVREAVVRLLESGDVGRVLMSKVGIYPAMEIVTKEKLDMLPPYAFIVRLDDADTAFVLDMHTMSDNAIAGAVLAHCQLPTVRIHSHDEPHGEHAAELQPWHGFTHGRGCDGPLHVQVVSSSQRQCDGCTN